MMCSFNSLENYKAAFTSGLPKITETRVKTEFHSLVQGVQRPHHQQLDRCSLLSSYLRLVQNTLPK